MLLINGNRPCYEICKLLIAAQILTLSGSAQELPTSANVNIEILDGNDAVNNIKQKIAREESVRVEEENHKPVTGALIVFTAPKSGPGGSFVDGQKNFQVVTGPDGVARARFHPNDDTGEYLLNVTAFVQDQKAHVHIHQMNVAGSSSAADDNKRGWRLSKRTVLVLTLTVAAGAVAGGLIAARGNGTATTVSPISGSVGAPH
jgi:hypothetical protein